MGTQVQQPLSDIRETRVAPAPRRTGLAAERQPGRADGGYRVAMPRTAPHGAVWQAPASGHVVALAGLQALLGYEWLVSGVDKLLYAHFPAALGVLLQGTLQGGRLPAFFAAFLRAVVLPHSVLFGVLVEWAETLAGLGLLGAALVALLTPTVRRRLAPAAQPWLARGEHVVAWLAAGAAAGAGLMGLTFYLLDGAPVQWVVPSVAFGGALDTGLMLALGSVVLLADAVAGRRFRREAPSAPPTERDQPTPGAQQFARPSAPRT